MTRSSFPLFALLIAALSCKDSSAPVASNPIGQQFRIVGEAAGGDTAGRTASCELNLVMEMGGESRPAAGAVEFAGVRRIP
jgi:hypothetical protein